MQAAFEGPKHAIGWSLPIVQQIRELLPQTCEFDGCAFGLVDQEMRPLLKPWRVITNMSELTSVLNRRCAGGHVHGSTHGVDALKSECIVHPCHGESSWRNRTLPRVGDASRGFSESSA